MPHPIIPCIIAFLFLAIFLWPACYWTQEHSWIYWRKPWKLRRCTTCNKVQIMTYHFGWVTIKPEDDDAGNNYDL